MVGEAIYGPGVLGILVWASVFLWLYLRFRTVLPLIVVHSCWDVFAFLCQHRKPVAGLEGFAWLALLVTAFILWLTHRSERNRPQILAVPGWYSDPAAHGMLRWYTGNSWGPSTQAIPPSPTAPDRERTDQRTVLRRKRRDGRLG